MCNNAKNRIWHDLTDSLHDIVERHYLAMEQQEWDEADRLYRIANIVCETYP